MYKIPSAKKLTDKETIKASGFSIDTNIGKNQVISMLIFKLYEGIDDLCNP